MDAAHRYPVVVIGGGIAGLTAAYRLRCAGVPILLVEAGARLGGKILTERRGEFVLEGGPDAFLATKPHGRELCEELGIAIVGSNREVRRAFIMRDGRLHPLPDGFTGVAPRRIGPMIRTPLLSVRGKLRMALEWFVPKRTDGADESMAALVRRRAGNEAWERLVEPLVTGVCAGDGESLSARAAFPMLPAAEDRHGGFIRAGRAARATGPSLPTALMFATPRQGLGELVGTLVKRIGDDAIAVGRPATAIRREGGSITVAFADGTSQPASAVIVATPAAPAADMLRGADPDLAGDLDGIEYVSTATVSLAYPTAAVGTPLDGHGYVIPRREGSPILACTITSTKFPHRAPAGWTLVRAFVGRAGQPDALAHDDDALIALARDGIEHHLGIGEAPAWARVFRWPDAIPQYNVGHLARVERIESRLAALPGVYLAGHTLRGIGIPDCIASGERAAAAAVAHVESGNVVRR